MSYLAHLMVNKVTMNIKQLAVFSGLLWVSFSSYASRSDNWESVSNIGSYGLISAAFITPMYKKDWDGFMQAGYSIGATSAIAFAGKSFIKEQRPDKSDDDSFPSGHTANAFAAATTLHLRYGWEAGVPAYGVAILVGVGRVQANKHYWKDVIAGAIIGSFSSWVFTDAFDENVQVIPWAGRNEVGLNVLVNW